MNARQTELLGRLRELVDGYIADPAVVVRLKANVEPLKVKYVLAELESNRIREFSAADQDWIKEIYFNFC